MAGVADGATCVSACMCPSKVPEGNGNRMNELTGGCRSSGCMYILLVSNSYGDGGYESCFP